MAGEDERKVRLSLPETLEVGIGMHRLGRLQEAEMIYRALLPRLPDDPNLLHFWGVLCHQLGRSEEGIESIRRSLEVDPENIDARVNLGNVLKERRRPEEAAACFRAAVKARPEHSGAWNNLGVAEKAQGNLDAAEAALRRAIAIDPSFAEAWHNLGNVLARLGRDQEASEAFRKAIGLEPANRRTYRYLAESLARLGKIEEAKGVFAEWIAFEPESAMRDHLQASILGGEAPERASDGYVRLLFDALADDFEEKLKFLDYRAPALVAAAVARACPEASSSLVVLDAGCGTGWCGPDLKKVASRLVGVDLSGSMLAHAKDRGVYDELVEAELTAYLESERDRFDLIVSADTLCYFGALERVAAAAAGALRPGGVLVFTLERLLEGNSWKLLPHGRYAHAEPYVRSVLEEAGLKFDAIEREALRRERGDPVEGLLVTASRT